MENWKRHPRHIDYEVSDAGRVRRVVGRGRNVKAIRILKTPPRTTGYLQVNLSSPRRNCSVHVLVLETFIGTRPCGHECRHLDGDRSNNRLSNLRWGTGVENCADSDRLGRKPKGETHGKAELRKADVVAIRNRFNAGILQRHLAAEYGVSRSHISGIVNRRFWRDA